MQSWTDEKSFPIVTLKRLKGPEKDLILAKQESFLEHKLIGVDSKLDTKTVGNSSSDQSEYKEKQKITSRFVRKDHKLSRNIKTF